MTSEWLKKLALQNGFRHDRIGYREQSQSFPLLRGGIEPVTSNKRELFDASVLESRNKLVGANMPFPSAKALTCRRGVTRVARL